MQLLLKNSLGLYKFYTNSSSEFVMETDNGGISVILSDVSKEYDGLCDKNDFFHFLIQTVKGGLLYLKYDGNVWKKYDIFQSKDKRQKICNIKLTISENMLCAFYIIEHNDRNMLVKHCFSAEKLYVTPEIVDIVDSKKCFCICSHSEDGTRVFYRDSAGRNQETVFDKFFVRRNHGRSPVQSEVFSIAMAYNNHSAKYAYVTVKKNYTTLIFSGDNGQQSEKIITFGISRNSNIGILCENNAIIVFWTEGNKAMMSKSSDDGESFTSPAIVGNYIEFVRYRENGINFSDCIHMSSVNMTKSTDNKQFERNDLMNKAKNNFDTPRRFNSDISSEEFVQKLGRIEQAVVQMSENIGKLCIFLKEPEDFKTRSEFDVFSQINNSQHTDSQRTENDDIGEKDEKNIRLFESMTIDEVLPNTENDADAFVASHPTE